MHSAMQQSSRAAPASSHVAPRLSRRGFLSGSCGLAAMMLPQAARAAGGLPQPARRAKSVIFLMLEGGLSHLDSWDLKPDAPAEIRGEFHQIATTNHDLAICEHMPHLAKQAHQYNVIRSVHSAARNHSPGLHWILTGYDNPLAGVNATTANKFPSQGSIVAHELAHTVPDGLPPFVAIPSRMQLGGRTYFAGPGHLGASFEAFDSGPAPATCDGVYSIPAGIALPKEFALDRLADRRAVLAQLDGLRRTVDAGVESFDAYRGKVFDLLLGGRGREAFNLNAEPAETRRLYGDSEMGQGTLLARRLVEAGVTYVLVNCSKNNSFDTHADNFGRLKRTLLPPCDRAASALIEDLNQRGLSDDVLVVMMGEMGRTPIINSRAAGRDHWPDVYSIMIAGGGLKRGMVLGTSTRGGEKPADRPVHVQEVLATIYHQLGIDHKLRLNDSFGRPIDILPEAEPVHELIA